MEGNGDDVVRNISIYGWVSNILAWYRIVE